MTSKPDAPSEYTGRNSPATTYRSWESIPRCEPSAAPAITTASVCPVIGTGDAPVWIATWAPSAVSAAPASTSATSRTRSPGMTSPSTDPRGAGSARWVMSGLLGLGERGDHLAREQTRRAHRVLARDPRHVHPAVQLGRAQL